MTQSLPIGLFDSGVGGFTVLSSLRKRFPHEHFIYFGDTARTPYGTKGKDTLICYANECAAFLLSHRIKLLIVACNTASAYVMESLHSSTPVPVIGAALPVAKQVASRSDRSRIAVLATASTIQSDIFPTSLRSFGFSGDIITRACPLFVPLVEEGLVDGPIVEAVLDKYLSDIRAWKPDAVLLGCTHYPLLREAIQRYFGDSVELFDSASGITFEAASYLSDSALSIPGTVQVFVSDSPERVTRLSPLFLGEAVDVVLHRVGR